MPMTRNQTKVMTETRNRGPEPCLALFSEWVAAVLEDDGSTILQLNVKGLTNSKLTIIEQLAHTNKVTAILLQETHCETTEKLTIPEFTLASHILNKQHGLATVCFLQPWITKGMLKSIRNKNTLYKEYLQCPNENRAIKFKTYRNKLNNLIRKSKRDYLYSKFKNTRNNMIETWKTINSIIGRGTKKSLQSNFRIDDTKNTF